LLFEIAGKVSFRISRFRSAELDSHRSSWQSFHYVVTPIAAATTSPPSPFLSSGKESLGMGDKAPKDKAKKKKIDDKKKTASSKPATEAKTSAKK
jgi:hypothetical protein